MSADLFKHGERLVSQSGIFSMAVTKSTALFKHWSVAAHPLNLNIQKKILEQCMLQAIPFWSVALLTHLRMTESIDISFISITFYSYYHCYILVVVHLACSQYRGGCQWRCSALGSGNWQFLWLYEISTEIEKHCGGLARCLVLCGGGSGTLLMVTQYK